MTNSKIFNNLKRNYKIVLSWILIIIMLIVGINWPDFNPKADIISDLGLKFITTDLERPYTVLTAEIEGSLSNVSYYLYQSNAPIYFLSDLKLLGIRASEDDVNNREISIAKYSFNSGFKNWESDSTEIISDSNKISNVENSYNYGSFIDDKRFYSISSIAGDYGVIDAIDDFGTSSYIPDSYGEYIIGYCGETTSKEYTLEDGSVSVEGSSILNKNFINYEKFNSDFSALPYYSISGTKTEDRNLDLNQFYRDVILFNNQNDGGWEYPNGSDTCYVNGVAVSFDFELFNSDSSHNESAILGGEILVPSTYVNYYNNSEMKVDFYANDNNLGIDYIADENGLITNANISYSEDTINNEVILTINDEHNIIFKVDSSKKIESIKLEKANDAEDISIALKVPMILRDKGNNVTVGKFVYFVLKEKILNTNQTDKSYINVLNAIKAKNTDSNFKNRLMFFSNYSDYDYSSTYTYDSLNDTYYVIDGFLENSNFTKDIYLKAYSSNTDIRCEEENGYGKIVDISNGITTYDLYGQIVGFLPESKTTNIDFSLNLGQNELDSSKSHLYVDSSGKTIYYSPSDNSSDKLELVNIEYSTGNSKLKLRADNITKYRLIMKDIYAFNSFGITAKVLDGTKTLSKSINIKLYDESNNSSFVEMYLDGSNDISFKKNWLKIEVDELVTSLPIENRYPSLPSSKTEMNSPYATLINYGEYQLLLYTNVRPIYSSNSLLLNSNSDIEIWRYYDKSWIFESYSNNVENGSIDLPLKAGLSSIDFINYDLVNSNNKTILSANEIYDDGAPKLRTIKIPELTSSDANHYIFVNNSIGYYAFTSSEEITANGNTEVSYPETGQWYVLVQNSWVKINESTAERNNFKVINRTDFEKKLKFTNDNNSAWTNVEEWSSSNWASSVDYFRYIPIYLATSGYSYFIYETTNGYESLEYLRSEVGDITITADGISFSNLEKDSSGNYRGIILKKYDYRSWITESDSILNDYISVVDGNYIFDRPGAMNSIIYSDRDIYDYNGDIVVSNIFSQSLIVSDALSVSDLSCTNPVSDSNEITINGESYPYVIVTSEIVNSNSTFVAYISNQPFKYSTAKDSFDIVSNDFPLKVYKEVWDVNFGKWGLPELVYDVNEKDGVVDKFTTSYTETSTNSSGTTTVVAIYNQYPNGRVTKYDTSLTNKVDGHFIISLKEDNSSSNLPSNAYEVYYDSTGKEYMGKWNWKWSDNGSIVDYYYTPQGVKVTDKEHKHRYYKIVEFEQGGNINEFFSDGEYLNFYGNKVDMGYKDLKGNWINDSGIVVTPSGNYGYYDSNLNIVSSRPKGFYYFPAEENGKIVAKEATITDSSDEEISSRVLDICSSSDIDWINRTIEAFEDVRISYEEYENVTFLDSSISAIMGEFINPKNVSSLDYIQPKDSVDNYWIAFFDSCGNIYNPFLNENNRQGKVALDIENYRFYVPNFGNVQKVIQGTIPKGGIAFDTSNFNENNFNKSETNWYTDSVSSDDILPPIISSVYMLNHSFKIVAEDPGAYATIFDSEGNVIYKEHTFYDNEIFYKYIPEKEYNNSLNKNDYDSDNIPYFVESNNKYYKMFDNNNVVLVSYTLDENGNTIESSIGDEAFTFVYTNLSVDSSFTENTEYINVGDLSLPKYIQRNDNWYVLSDSYYIVDNVLYREVKSNEIYEKRAAIKEDKPKETLNLTSIEGSAVDTEHGEARNIISGVSFDYYYNNQFVKTIPINQLYTYDDGTNRWGVLYTILEISKVDSQGKPYTVEYNNVQVITYNTVTSYKYLVEAKYISRNYDITRLLKILSNRDIENISKNNSWEELVSTKDSKGLYTYYDSSNSLWNGNNLEAISGTTIGDDGYLYKNGSKVSASTEYDENGNPISYDISGIDKFYITIEKDFTTDIDFSYDDGTGNIVSFKKGDYVSAKLLNGDKRVITLDSNVFTFPVDVVTGTLTINAYVLDKAGNKSSSISGPWVLKRNDLSSTKDWKEYFIAGTATSAIISEIEYAIDANTSDTKSPEITGVFLYKGTLYIVAKDEDDEETGAKASGIGIAGTYNYLFKHTLFENPDDTTLNDISYYSMSGMSSSLKSGTILSNLVNMDLGEYNAYFECIKDSNGKIQTAELDLSAFDIARNQSDIVHVNVSEEDNNSVLFGNVSQNIYEMLLAAREESGNKDTIAPIIKAIYTLKGILYVEATDNLGIKDYGYKWALDSKMSADTTGLDDEGNEITIKEGEDIPKGTIIWHGAAQQPVTIPTKMVIYVEDNSGNSSYETVVISSSSQLLYGEVSEEIMKEIMGGGEEVPSNTAPIITNVYTYKGYLYFEGYDTEDNLATWCYGFKPLDNMKLNSNYEGYNASFKPISIPAGDTVKANQLIYKKVNSQEINIPINITISLRDTLGLETSETFYIFKDNYVYKGKAPDNIKGEIENPDGPGENPTPTPTPNPGDPDNPTPTPTPLPDPDKPINPPGEFDDIDWKVYDYLFEILDNDTNRIVYSIRQDEASSIDCPRLENSVLYKYKMSAINEEDDSVLLTYEGQIRMKDTIAPTITKIWYSKNRVYVSAYDLGGFDETPFCFNIEGSRDTTDKFIANNNTVVLSGETINIKVKDASGNISTAKVTINEKTKDILYESLNPKDYLYINSNETKSLAYWFAYINTKYGIDVSDTYLSEKNKSENINFEIKNNNVYLDLKGDGVISFYDNKSNKYLALNLRTLNTGKSYRSIVVQTGSEIDVSLAFKNKLLEQFGTIDGLSWYADGDILTRIGSTAVANKTGVGKIKFIYDGKELDTYILVADSISKTTSSCNFEKENFAYTYLLKDKVNLSKALRLDSSSESNNIILESATTGVIRTDNIISFNTSGVKTLNFIDCVTDELGEIKFEVISITPYISTFTDIIGSSARADIETLCEKGFIGEYPDNKYKPSNKMTTKEFLTMINKIKLTYDSDFEINKIFTNLNLSEKDFDYYSSQNILINMTQEEVDNTIGTYTLNKAITFEEVVKLISATILYDDYHNEEGIKAPEGLSNCAQQAIHLISMGIIDEKDTRNGSRELTRAEIAYILTKTVKYLDL